MSHFSTPEEYDSSIISSDDRILVTGATGSIGARVVATLLDRGFRNLICFTRPSSKLATIEAIIKRRPGAANRGRERQSSVQEGLRDGG